MKRLFYLIFVCAVFTFYTECILSQIKNSNDTRPYPIGFDPEYIPPLTNEEMSEVLLLDPVPLPFFDNMENGENGWTHTGFDHLIINPQNLQVMNPTINPNLVSLPDAGFLPIPHSGVGAWWYGENTTGTFIGSDFDPNQPLLSGGTSVAANTGNLISPQLDLTGISVATLSFETWWEIEGVDAHAYDMMYIEISIDGGITFFELGKLNPLNDLNGAHHVSYTNSGLGLPATWEGHVFDLSGYVGNIAILRFRFDTRDALYNGFRGWFIDDVSVTGTPIGTPVITEIIPEIGNPGSIFNIYGSNFATGATVTFEAVTIGSVVLNSNTIQCQVPSLPNGNYDVTVTNPGGASTTQIDGFNITTVTAPIINTVNPNTGLQNEAVFIQINGQNFNLGASATIGGIQLTNINVSTNLITGYSSPYLGIGSHIVRVQNPDGQYDILVNGFTVNPLITVISPNGGEILNAGSSFNISYYLQDATSVKIEYSANSGFYWNYISTTGTQGIGTHTYNWTNIPSINSDYCLIRISKTDNGSLKDISNNPFSILIGSGVPNSPSYLNVQNIGLNYVNLNWTDNSNNETGFYIYRRLESGTWNMVGTVGANITNFSSTGLNPNTTYLFYVVSYNAQGISGYSNTAIATTGYLPAVPTNLVSIVLSSSSIKLNWTDNANNESGFRVERNSGSGWIEIATLSSNSQTYTNNNLGSGITYSYRLRAFNQFGNSDYSNTASSTTGSIPNAPTNLIAITASTSQINLTWNDNSLNETGFIIESKQGNSAWAQIAQVNANVTSFSHTNLNSGTTYYYRIYAIGNNGCSFMSNVASATTQGVPNNPSNLSGTILSLTQIKLNWNDQSNNESGFKIERKGGLFGIFWSVIATVGQNVEEYIDNDVSSTWTYHYRVRAYNSSGNSGPTNEIAIKTGSTTFSADILASDVDGPVQGAKVYVDRNNNGFPESPEPGETNSNGLLTVDNLNLGDILLVTVKKGQKDAVKAGHSAVDNIMYELHLDNGTIRNDGAYDYYTINAQLTQYNIFLGHPLFKYNLVVSIEWDASSTEINRFVDGFKKASNYFYDVSDGQMLLNKIAIYENGVDWSYADMRVENNNDLRPHNNSHLPNGIYRTDTQIIFGNKVYGDNPNQSKYYRGIIHELGHYALGLYDEYIDGLGGDSFNYRSQHPNDFPSNYGYMDSPFEYTEGSEMSSSNDYNQSYPTIDPAQLTKQYTARLMPCWEWVNQEFENTWPGIQITTPPSGWWPDAITDDRSGPNDEVGANVIPPALENYLEPTILVFGNNTSANELNVKINSNFSTVPGVRVFVQNGCKIDYRGKSDINGNIDMIDVSPNSKIYSYRFHNWKMYSSKENSSDIYANTQIEINNNQQQLASPGIILETHLIQRTPTMLVNLLLKIDQPTITTPEIKYYFAGDSGTVLLTNISQNVFSGNVNVNAGLPDLVVEGYLDITITDSSSVANTYISEITVYPIDGLSDGRYQTGKLLISPPKEFIQGPQFIIINSTYAIPFKSYSQNIIPVSDMYTFELSEQGSFIDSIGINIYYDNVDIIGIDESSIALFRWNPSESIWQPLSSSYVNLRDNVVTGYELKSGTYAAFATLSSDDIISPARIEDLSASFGPTYRTILLSWTAVGDDSIFGKSSNYEIRWFDKEINSTNWDSAGILLYNKVPSYTGENESAVFKFDDPNRNYYFAVKAIDEANNFSDISNSSYSYPNSIYHRTIPVSLYYGNDIVTHFIGRNENASDDFDDGLDIVSNPPTPGFYSYFLANDDTKLTKDFRNFNEIELQWELVIEGVGPTDTSIIVWDPSTILSDGEYSINGQDMVENNTLVVLGNDTVSITFTRTIAPMSAPSLISPLNGSISQPSTILLKWNFVPDAETYRVQVSTDSTFTIIVFEDSTIANPEILIDSLSNDSTYFWRVLAKNILGTGPYSEHWKFTVSTHTTAIIENWNMISVPLVVTDYRKTALYPTAISPAWKYESNYQQEDTLENGIGYWIKFDEPQYIGLIGDQISLDTIPVVIDWNIIGSISESVPIVDIITNPPNLVTSSYYTYDTTGYIIVNTIEPGKGYWVKTNDYGELILPYNSENLLFAAPKANDILKILKEYSEITIRDSRGQKQKLYFGIKSKETNNLNIFEMPPLAPSDIFDARFESNRMLEAVEIGQNKECPIKLKSAEFPLTLSWELNQQTLNASMVLGENTIEIIGRDSISVFSPKDKITLIFEDNSTFVKTYALEQNYPNPFNPITTIKYQIPKKDKVTIEVFDILGQRIKTLVDEIKDPGRYEINWNSNNDNNLRVATGVYIYRMRAGDYMQTKKMILLK